MADEFDLDLASGRLRAQRFGCADAPLVLAVHGLSANMHSFDYLAPALVADGMHQVVAVDLRGRGASDVTAPGTYGLDSHARDVLEAATILGHESFAWVGWSLGALIGMIAARMEPERVRRLGLIDHAGRSDKAAVSAVISGLDRLDLDLPSAADYVARVEEQSPIRPFNEFWRGCYGYEFRRTDKAACLEDLRDVAKHDWPQLWPELNLPVLMLRCRRTLNGGLIVPDDVAAEFRCAVPTSVVTDVDADHFTVMTRETAAESLRSLLT